jgi:hypothetical protein
LTIADIKRYGAVFYLCSSSNNILDSNFLISVKANFRLSKSAFFFSSLSSFCGIIKSISPPFSRKSIKLVIDFDNATTLSPVPSFLIFKCSKTICIIVSVPVDFSFSASFSISLASLSFFNFSSLISSAFFLISSIFSATFKASNNILEIVVAIAKMAIYSKIIDPFVAPTIFTSSVVESCARVIP